MLMGLLGRRFVDGRMFDGVESVDVPSQKVMY